jgi:hypothetical protein
MKRITLVFMSLILSVGLYNTQVFGADLTLPTGGRVAIELITSYADFHNTLSLVSPNAAIVLTGCEVEAINALPLELLSEKISQHGCRVELDANPATPGVQPFNAGDVLEFNLCAQTDANPATCEHFWSSNPSNNTDGKDHVKTTELHAGDPDVGGRIFMLEWEDLDGLGDEDFNDLIAVVRVIQDTDGDGLWDDWEKFGIDTNGNGTVDYVIPGADPQHKDIYIEIDYMDCAIAGGDCAAGDTHSHRPKQDAINEVVQAFANATVTNPDGNDGITLHVDVDDAIPHDNELNLGCFAGTRNFDTIKNDPNFFGPNNPRRFTHHYVIFGHQQTATTTSSGCGEVDGNDFIVTLGHWNYRCQGGANAGGGCANNTDCPGGVCQGLGDVDGDGDDDHDVGSDRQQSGTLMHELGHNLDLRHGGDVDTNYKPNYLSIMSYRYQFSGILPSNRLDYSADDLPDLDEDSDLDEPDGIQDGTDDTRYNCPDGTVRTGAGLGAIDWNCDNDGGIDLNVRVDINDDSAFNVLTGFDDWGNLKYDFQNSANFQDGVHDILDEPDMDFKTYMMVINNPPVADAGSDQTIDCTCSGGDSVTLDGSGSYDPDNDLLTYTWTGVFGTLSGEVVQPLLPPGVHTIILTVEDNKGGSASDSIIVTVNEDTAPPVISCNAPATITPPDAPISFTVSATDNCDDTPAVEITGFDCYMFTKKGEQIDKTESCVVSIEKDIITILDSGGVGTHITWMSRATDSCVNVAEETCETLVVNPSK